MPTWRKSSVYLFLFFVISAIILGILYFIEIGNNPYCRVTIRSNIPQLSVKISNRKKLYDFIGQLTECRRGYTVYTFPAKKEIFVNSVSFEFSNTPQPHSFKSREGNLLYTYSILVDESKKTAVVTLHFPDVNNLQEKTLHNSLFLTSYKLFKGSSYKTVENNLLRFGSLKDLGISYEIL